MCNVQNNFHVALQRFVMNLSATSHYSSKIARAHLRLPWGKAAVVVESRRRLLSESV